MAEKGKIGIVQCRLLPKIPAMDKKYIQTNLSQTLQNTEESLFSEML